MSRSNGNRGTRKKSDTSTQREQKNIDTPEGLDEKENPDENHELYARGIKKERGET